MSFTRFRGAFIHPPRLISALPELFYKRTHYLNSFRRKPAISRID